MRALRKSQMKLYPLHADLQDFFKNDACKTNILYEVYYQIVIYHDRMSICLTQRTKFFIWSISQLTDFLLIEEISSCISG